MSTSAAFLLLQLLMLSQSCRETLQLLANANHWMPPTPTMVQTSIGECSETLDKTLDSNDFRAELIYCTSKKLGLWSDATGYNTKRIVKMFAHYNQTQELHVVIDYCNMQQKQLHQQTPAQWAYGVYNCVTVGRIGQWLHEYTKQDNDIQSTSNYFK